MTRDPQRTVTRLLGEVRDGNRESFDRLFPLVYDELRSIARQQRRRAPAVATLDTHALVHEAYLKLVDQTSPDWRTRGHFSAVAAKAMRYILVDYARRKGAEKRGGGRDDVPLDKVAAVLGEAPNVEIEGLIALNDALAALESESPREAKIVELKFFGGLTVPEIAETLDISTATVKRGWALARAWLYREMTGVPK